jgi:hypothetical protein
MSPRKQLSEIAKLRLQYYVREREWSVAKIMEEGFSWLRGFSRATIYRHATGKHGARRPSSGRPVGRPGKITKRDSRLINRSVHILRKSIGSFTTVDVQKHAHLNHVDNSTVRKAMYAMGYKYRVTRKKGQLLVGDFPKRLKWAKMVKKKVEGNINEGGAKTKEELWREGINMYVDIVGFEYKVNLLTSDPLLFDTHHRFENV